MERWSHKQFFPFVSSPNTILFLRQNFNWTSFISGLYGLVYKNLNYYADIVTGGDVAGVFRLPYIQVQNRNKKCFIFVIFLS